MQQWEFSGEGGFWVDVPDPMPISLVDLIRGTLSSPDSGGVFNHYDAAGQNDFTVGAFQTATPRVYNYRGTAPADVLAAFGAATPQQVSNLINPDGPGNGNGSGSILQGAIVAGGFLAAASGLMGVDFSSLLSSFTTSATGESLIGATEFAANAGAATELSLAAPGALAPLAAPTAESLVGATEFAANAGAATELSIAAPGTVLATLAPLAAPTAESLVGATEFAANAGAATELSLAAPGTLAAASMLPSATSGLKSLLSTASTLKSLAGAATGLAGTAAALSAKTSTLSAKSAGFAPLPVFGPSSSAAIQPNDNGPAPILPGNGGPSPGASAYTPWIAAAAITAGIYFLTEKG